MFQWEENDFIRMFYRFFAPAISETIYKQISILLLGLWNNMQHDALEIKSLTY